MKMKQTIKGVREREREREDGIEQHSRGVEGVNENLCFRALLSIVCQSGIAKRERENGRRLFGLERTGEIFISLLEKFE